MAIDLQKWKEAKKKIGWTYETIADQAGVSKRTVEDIFRGYNKNPKIETINAIENALGLRGDVDINERGLYLDKVKELVTVDEYLLLTYYREIGQKYGETQKALSLEILRLIAEKGAN